MTTTTTAIAPIELQKISTKDSTHASLYHLPRDQPAGAADSTMPSETSSSAEQAALDSQDAAQGTASKDPKHVRRARVQFLALCWCLFLAGWNDGSIGPMLPRIREVYNVGYTVVSLIFIIACVGFCIGALINVFATGRISFGKIIVIGCTLQTIAYAIQSSAPPFPLFVVAFAINGAGLAVQDAQANGYVASWNDNNKMGVLHAAYGLGAFCAPLVSTQFAQLDRWSFHFLVSMGIALSNIVVLTIVFKFKDQDECLHQIGRDAGEKSSNEQSNIRQLVRLKAVHLLAAFIFIYVGVEVTIGGWTVTYIIEERDGGPSAGYISSGFFGGLTVGRVILLWVNKKIGERRVLFLYSALAIVFELIVWLVPSLIGGAVAVSIVGVLLGPYYPIAMNHAGKILPRWLLTVSIGWIAGLGQAGTAALPFMTGAFAGRFGISSLQPLLVAMMGAMTVLWALVPNHASRLD